MGPPFPCRTPGGLWKAHEGMLGTVTLASDSCLNLGWHASESHLSHLPTIWFSGLNSLFSFREDIFPWKRLWRKLVEHDIVKEEKQGLIWLILVNWTVHIACLLALHTSHFSNSPTPPQPFFPSTQSTQIEANILQILTLSVVFSIKNGTNKKNEGEILKPPVEEFPGKTGQKLTFQLMVFFFGWSWGILGNFARIHPAVKKTAR